MKRLTQFVLRLYPADWRARYQAEMEALIKDSGQGWLAVADLLKGAIGMQLKTWPFWKLATALGLAGIVVTAGAAKLLLRLRPATTA
jgi:hypothetical protein